VNPGLAANGHLGQPGYGVCLDDPKITLASECRYDAAVEVRTEIALPGESQTMTIPGGRYAVTSFRGTVEQIGDAWDAMLRDWMPRNGMQLDARPVFEYYPAGASVDPRTGLFSCDITIPVVLR